MSSSDMISKSSTDSNIRITQLESELLTTKRERNAAQDTVKSYALDIERLQARVESLERSVEMAQRREAQLLIERDREKDRSEQLEAYSRDLELKCSRSNNEIVRILEMVNADIILFADISFSIDIGSY